jgi:acetoin utilization protein AcuB
MLGTVSVDFVQPLVRDGMVSSPVITPRTSVGAALRLMREHHLPALPVCEGNVLMGLVDEKALLRLTPSEATTLDVWEIHEALEKMTVASVVAEIATIGVDESLYQAADLMDKTCEQVLPVMEKGHLAGLLPWNALLAAMARTRLAEAA